MEKLIFLSIILLINISSMISHGNALSSCNGPCQSLNDCSGQLICINGKCNDDPDVGTHICTASPPPPRSPPPPLVRSPSPPPPRSSPPPPARSPPPSSCGGSCQTLNDCPGQLICINGKCNDDPDVGTHICNASPPPPASPRPPPPPSSGGGGCQQSGTLTCGKKTYPTYTCSPPVTSSTPANLTFNDFASGGDGGDPSECDEMFHSNSEKVVALSTGWYNGGSRCGMNVRITAKNGRSVLAKVVDECDSRNGCDAEHAGLPPCENNIVDGSQAVWDALGLDTDVGIIQVTWSMA